MRRSNLAVTLDQMHEGDAAHHAELHAGEDRTGHRRVVVIGYVTDVTRRDVPICNMSEEFAATVTNRLYPQQHGLLTCDAYEAVSGSIDQC